MATPVGGLLVNIGLDVAQIKQDVGKAQRELSGFRNKVDRQMGKMQRSFKKATSGLKGLVAVMGGAALVRNINRAAEGLEDVNRAAESLGAQRSTIQELTFTFKEFRLQQDDVTDALGTLSDRAQDAKDGMKSFQEDFELVGISVDDLRRKEPGELFDLFAEKIAKVNDPTKRTAAAVRIFGDDLGRKLLPMLMKGREGLEDYAEQAREAGAVMSDSLVKDGAEAAKTMRELRATLDAQFTRAVANSADELETTANALIDIATWGAKAAASLVKVGESMQFGSDEANQFTAQTLGGTISELERLQSQLDEMEKKREQSVVEVATPQEKALQKEIKLLKARRDLLERNLQLQAKRDIESNTAAFGFGSGGGDTGRGGTGDTGDTDTDPVLLGRVGRRGRGQSSYLQDIVQIQKDAKAARKAGSDLTDVQVEIQNNQVEVNQTFQRTGDIVADSFRAASREGSTLRGVVQGLLRDLAQMQVNQASNNIGNAVTDALTASMGSGSSSGGALASVGGVGGATPRSFDGGGYTGDGPRSGGLDGKGGFMAMMHPRERVIDQTKGGGDTYNIDARGADQAAVARLERTIKAVNGSIERRAVSAVGSQRQRRFRG